MFEENIEIVLKGNRPEIIEIITKNTDQIHKNFISLDYTKKFKGKVFESGFRLERIKKGKTAYTPIVNGICYDYNDYLLLKLIFKIKRGTILSSCLGIIIYSIVFVTSILHINKTNIKLSILFILLFIVFLVGTIVFIFLNIEKEKKTSKKLIFELLRNYISPPQLGVCDRGR